MKCGDATTATEASATRYNSVVYGRNAENEPVSRIKMADYYRPLVSMGTLRGGWTRPRDVYGIIAFQSTGLRECMGKAVRFSAQFHQGASNRIWRNSRTL